MHEPGMGKGFVAITKGIAMRRPSPRPVARGHDGSAAAGAETARCALCGFIPPNGGTPLRQLGTSPVTLTVCADLDACVTS